MAISTPNEWLEIRAFQNAHLPCGADTTLSLSKTQDGMQVALSCTVCGAKANVLLGPTVDLTPFYVKAAEMLALPVDTVRELYQTEAGLKELERLGGESLELLDECGRSPEGQALRRRIMAERLRNRTPL